jgi:putative NADPH-quinone reductase
MRQKKIVILLGHTDTSSVCCALTDAYEAAARGAGHIITRFNIAEMKFDPILHNGYRTIQELEPDLVRFQEALTEADHFVLIYPNWWSGPPAILKGFFDRVWLPGFAFKYIKSSSGNHTFFWHRLLKGKTARVIVTTGFHPLFLRILYGNFIQEISIGILWFAGLKVSETILGPIDNPSDVQKNTWLAQMRHIGARGE